MDTFNRIVSILSLILGILMIYKGIYTAIGFFSKPKIFPPAPMTRKYGIIIAARNESKVIGLLLDSLNAQTYPSELYQIFVVADNCTDDTADIAASHGARVYKRDCPEKARKGWALEYLFEQIDRDFGIESFDGYLFFDADNIVSRDYIQQIHNAFATGCDAVIGYRNTKNFDRNWISAHYGIHFMRSSLMLHRPRSRLGLSSHIAGTGYLLSSQLVKEGWHYSCLTEDTQATMDFTARGKRIEYCEAAEFYDEQPYQFGVMVRQRIRWAKGRIACFFAFGYKLIGGMFRRFPRPESAPAEDFPKEKSATLPDTILNAGTKVAAFLEKCIRPVSRNFSCYDMFFYLFPNSMVFTILGILQQVGIMAASFQLTQWAFQDVALWILACISFVFGSLFSYIGNIILGLLVVIRERKHIRCSKGKLALYLLSWPLFDTLYAYLCVISLFIRVQWKPIKHDEAISLEDLDASDTKEPVGTK